MDRPEGAISGPRQGFEVGWRRSIERIGWHREGHRLDSVGVAGQELAVAGDEDLVALHPVVVELLADHRPLDGAGRAWNRLVERLHGDLFEDHAGDVLGPERVAELRV